MRPFSDPPPATKDGLRPTPEAAPLTLACLAGVHELVSPQVEARAFHRMRGRMLWTMVRQTLSHARLRLLLIIVLSVLLWFALYRLFAEGFYFLETALPYPDLREKTVEAVFGTFFVTLTVMLIFSTGVILYSSLFRGEDIPFLFTLPARTERVFLHKFQEAVLMSSWAFLLLGSPMLIAYGRIESAPWYYYAMLLPFLMAFVYIPAGLGAMLCLELVFRVPRARGSVLFGAVVGVLALALLWAQSVMAKSENDMLTPTWFQEMLGRLRITDYRLLPSWWLTTGLMEATRKEAAESVMFLCLMISNALFFRQLASWTAAHIYRGAYNRLHGHLSPRRRAKPLWADRLFYQWTPMLTRQMRLLIVKDLRLFRRDPMQWSQFLIFFGLVAFYFLNIRRFTYDVYYVSWVNLVSFLNVSVVGLLLSTFTTRFVFPMMSLEGRRFWVLGLIPLKRETILWSKFLFAVGGSIVPSSLLVLLSDMMLGVVQPIVIIHQVTCVVLCCGLAGIAVGLGAKMPNLRESSPSRIAAGFGGTLCLVLSTLYIMAVVVMTAMPSHFFYGGADRSFPLLTGGNVTFWLQVSFFAGLGGSALLGIVATVLPLWLGFRAFRRLEL